MYSYSGDISGYIWLYWYIVDTWNCHPTPIPGFHPTLEVARKAGPAQSALPVNWASWLVLLAVLKLGAPGKQRRKTVGTVRYL